MGPIRTASARPTINCSLGEIINDFQDHNIKKKIKTFGHLKEK